MKTSKLASLYVLALIAFNASFARAQAPASLTGATMFQTATAAASPFDYPNYGLVFFASSGNTFASGGIMDGSAASPTTGTYGYVQSGPDGLFSATNHVGSFTGDYTYSSADSGTYVLNQSSSGGYQDGTFVMYAGQAPGSLAGDKFDVVITDSQNDSFTGPYTLTFTAKTATRVNNSGTANFNYTYSLANQSSGKVKSTSSSGGTTTTYFCFSDPTDGAVATYNTSGYWEVGTFTIIDATAPTNQITAPKSGLLVSNANYTITGTASDNVAVAGVYYSLNNGDFTLATPGNTWSTWSAEVTLTPGTNTISAYTLDTSSNYSKTNATKVVYIVTAQLTVNIVGDGSLKQDLNGETLVVGKNYTMTATPAKGFGFFFWNVGAAMSNSPTLDFTMAQGLVITANFRDITPPKVTITAPKANSKESNATITVSGTATDNVAVTNISVRINNGDWINLAASSASVNWSVTDVPIAAGSNVLQACAVDAANNISPTNTVRFIGELPPTSLSGYTAIVTLAGQAQKLDLSWSDTTWAQAGTSTDTNADNYAAGDYTYLQTSPTTAILTNMDVGMMSALGVTNVTVLYLTYTSASAASFVWTNGNDSGSGTMVLAQAGNLVPASLTGKTLKLGGSSGPTLTFASDGTFHRTQGSNSSTGTYTFIQYSPTVGVIVQSYTDISEAGALGYIELDFSSTTAGAGFGCYYQTPAFGNNPDDTGVGAFTLK